MLLCGVLVVFNVGIKSAVVSWKCLVECWHLKLRELVEIVREWILNTFMIGIFFDSRQPQMQALFIKNYRRIVDFLLSIKRKLCLKGRMVHTRSQ
jgi:hypothetical protein